MEEEDIEVRLGDIEILELESRHLIVRLGTAVIRFGRSGKDTDLGEREEGSKLQTTFSDRELAAAGRPTRPRSGGVRSYRAAAPRTQTPKDPPSERRRVTNSKLQLTRGPGYGDDPRGRAGRTL